MDLALGQQAVNLSYKDLLNILWELVHKVTEVEQFKEIETNTVKFKMN